MTRIDLTEDERWNLAIDCYEIGAISRVETENILKSLTSAQEQLKKKPTGKELLNAATRQLRQENPKWKPHQFQNYIERHIKKYFKKTPKPFSDQDVKVGAEWYATAIKTLMAEKARNGQRQRPRVNIRIEKWKELFKLRFGTPTPEFARKFQDAVRAKHRKHSKYEKAQNVIK